MLVERLAQHLELRLLGLERDRARRARARPRRRGAASSVRERSIRSRKRRPKSTRSRPCISSLTARQRRAFEAWRFRLSSCFSTSLTMSFTRSRFCCAASSLSWVWRRRALYFVIPAASSMIARRSVGFAREDLADLALLDDRVGLRAEPGVHEQLVDVAQAAELAVHQVLALAVPVEAARDDALGRSVGAVAVEARDLQVDLGHLQRLAARGAVEDHVLHRRAAQALDALLAEHPVDRVRDVALAAAVRADDAR